MLEGHNAYQCSCFIFYLTRPLTLLQGSLSQCRATLCCYIDILCKRVCWSSTPCCSLRQALSPCPCATLASAICFLGDLRQVPRGQCIVGLCRMPPFTSGPPHPLPGATLAFDARFHGDFCHPRRLEHNGGMFV